MKLLLYVKYLNSDFSCFYFNNLVILGPKKENGNYYTYCYLSQPNIKYCDPAKHCLKYNNFNSDIKNDLIHVIHLVLFLFIYFIIPYYKKEY